MEKASSLIEGDEHLDQVTDGNTAGRVTSQGPTSEESAPRDLASGMHPRAVRPVESGVFSGGAAAVSGDRLVESLQSALSAASRSEAGLGSLHRSVRDASRALTASRHAQESLTEELRVMYRGLNEVMSEKAAVERYAALLTQERDAALDAAEEARREAKREREFLIREQDRFIQLLLEEHEAELQQLRRGLGFRSSEKLGSSSLDEEVAPATVPGVAPMGVPDLGLSPFAAGEASASAPPEEDNQATPRASGAALARLALVNTGSSDRHLQVSLGQQGLEESRRSEIPGWEGDPLSDDRVTLPPSPAVLDLDSLAAEVDGNSERPPPIRRLGGEPILHLKPARVPSQLFDTLASSSAGESDPKRKS